MTLPALPTTPWLTVAAIALMMAGLAFGSTRIAGAYGAPSGKGPLLLLGALVAACSLAVPGFAPFVASLALGWCLATLIAIDLRVHRLPDALTLPLLVAGLGVTALIRPERLLDHALGAISGYSALALLAMAYRKARGRLGLGMGDAKLLAAGGAWLGWQALPAVLVIASVAGLAIAIIGARATRKLSMTTAVAFGPALALGVWSVWIALRLAD